MARGGEHSAQDLSNPFRFFIDLLFAEPENLKSLCPQVEVAPPVVAKGLAAPVVAIAIGLDSKPTVAPEKVDQVAANANVDFGRRQHVPPADPQKVSLQVAASAIAADMLAERQPEYIGLPNRPAPLRLRDNTTNVGDRSRRGGHRDAIATGDMAWEKRRTTMQPNAPLWLSASMVRNHRFDRAGRLLQQSPESRCAPVADDRPLSAGEGCRQPTTFRRKPRMTHRINTTMNPVQLARLHAARNCTPAHPNRTKLLD
jgi:hypothetical protein